MSRLHRRGFLGLAGAAASFAVLPGPLFGADARSPNERLRIGVVGVSGRGAANLAAVAGEEIRALCDVDARRLEEAAARFPEAATHRDWRDMLAIGGLDAVVVSTPDHLHAPIASQALAAGLDVYCEKPLTHTVAEARRLRELAEKGGRVTQMGIQIHALDNYHRVVESVRSGMLGDVRECHVFCNGKAWSATGRPAERDPVPDGLDWDLWIGPAEPRPFDADYHPAGWRRYWDFGAGTLGDMACHYLDLAFWALELDAPTVVRPEGPAPHPYAAPPGLAIHYEFPATPRRAPVKLSWWDGDLRPLEALEARGLGSWRNGVLFVGSRGWLVADYTRRLLGPDGAFDAVRPPAPWLKASPGHHREWLEACRTRSGTSCGFDYSGPLSEAVLLGVAAHRAGEAFAWDAATMRCRGSARAQALIAKDYREGFELA